MCRPSSWIVPSEFRPVAPGRHRPDWMIRPAQRPTKEPEHGRNGPHAIRTAAWPRILMIVDGLTAEGKDPKTAKVVYSGGDPTDGNAAQFYAGRE
jgi:hypothetical protein